MVVMLPPESVMARKRLLIGDRGGELVEVRF
jgi:hypothetical protein